MCNNDCKGILFVYKRDDGSYEPANLNSRNAIDISTFLGVQGEFIADGFVYKLDALNEEAPYFVHHNRRLYPAACESTFAVLLQYFYYAGTLNRPRDTFVKDSNGRVMEFDSVYEAFDAARELQESLYTPYILGHGEHSRPRYRVVAFGKYAGAHCFTPLVSDSVNDADIPKDILEELLDANVEYWNTDEDGDSLYRYEVERDGKVYGIVYGVFQEWEEYHVDDLSNITWDAPAFYVRDAD